MIGKQAMCSEDITTMFEYAYRFMSLYHKETFFHGIKYGKVHNLSNMCTIMFYLDCSFAAERHGPSDICRPLNKWEPQHWQAIRKDILTIKHDLLRLDANGSFEDAENSNVDVPRSKLMCFEGHMFKFNPVAPIDWLLVSSTIHEKFAPIRQELEASDDFVTDQFLRNYDEMVGEQKDKHLKRALSRLRPIIFTKELDLKHPNHPLSFARFLGNVVNNFKLWHHEVFGDRSGPPPDVARLYSKWKSEFGYNAGSEIQLSCDRSVAGSLREYFQHHGYFRNRIMSVEDSKDSTALLGLKHVEFLGKIVYACGSTRPDMTSAVFSILKKLGDSEAFSENFSLLLSLSESGDTHMRYELSDIFRTWEDKKTEEATKDHQKSTPQKDKESEGEASNLKVAVPVETVRASSKRAPFKVLTNQQIVRASENE